MGVATINYFFQVTVILVMQRNLNIAMQIISIRDGTTNYEYDLGSCAGGIQIRDINGWFSQFKKTLCICGSGTYLQFEGEGRPWKKNIYPIGFPPEKVPFLGSFSIYNFKAGCELLQGNLAGSLFVDVTKYRNSENMASNLHEVLVTPIEHKRMIGGYSIQINQGLNNRSRLGIEHMLKSVIFSTRSPFLISQNDKGTNLMCAFDPANPVVYLSKYQNIFWKNSERIADGCRNSFYRPYTYPFEVPCPLSREGNVTANSDFHENSSKKITMFSKILNYMVDISVRLKTAETQVAFTNDEPFIKLLEKSARVFFRAFPHILKWEALMNTLAIFAITFEGLLPTGYRSERDTYHEVIFALGRCAILQDRNQVRYFSLQQETCQLNYVRSSNITSGIPQAILPPQPANKLSKRLQAFNKLIELLWKTVQITQAICQSVSDYSSQVRHFYVGAMLELFSSPAVQRMWYQPRSLRTQLNRALLRILPELPDRALLTMASLLEKAEFSSHFGIIKRPKIRNLEGRDMRCAAQGKLIWDGKACCYQKEDDGKFGFHNRITFATL